MLDVSALSGLVGRLDRDGYVVIPQVLDRRTVAALVEVVDRITAEEVAAGRAVAGGPVHALEIADRDPALVALAVHPLVLGLVSSALGWNIHLYHSHADVHPFVPHPRRAWRWHQDGGRQNLELASTGGRPRLSLKVAYFLTDVSQPGRGNLLVIPGSHTQDTLDRSVDPPAGALPVLAPAGSACVLDRRVWHARSDNRSPMTRKVVFLAFTYRWVRPRHDHRRPGAGDPLVDQLLGAAATPLGQWIPDESDVPLRGWMAARGLLDPALPSHR